MDLTGFYKQANVRTVGFAEAQSDRLTRIAVTGQSAPPKSYYLDGSRTIPVSELLKRVADVYAISSDPTHYLFEAIRANTTNAPNENNDGFQQKELVRFDTKLGLPVYRTYVGKAHHVNHKTDNPKAARGVIIDSHYNEDAPPLENCPRCSLHTALRQNRGGDGLHCRRCGHLVKDEFVEILLGIDAHKDERFANGVRSGQLDAGSMGCNCLSTECNVCTHVAFSRPEFCEHIRAGNKGSLWKRHGSTWVKTSPFEVQREVEKRGLRWDPTDFCFLVAPDGFEVRKAFEYCQWVIFDEYSRVDQPADPKARQREILRTASVGGPRRPSPDELRSETEDLIRSIAMKRQAALQVAAGKFVVVRVGGDDRDLHAGATIDEALSAAGLGSPDEAQVDYCEVEASSAEEALSKFDPAAAKPVNGHDADVVVQAPPNEPIVVQPPGGAPGAPGAPGAQPPTSIDDLQNQQTAPGPQPAPQGPQQQMSPAEMGMLPPGAAAPGRSARSKLMRFANTYRGYAVEVSPQGNVRVFTANKEPVLVVRGEPSNDPQKRHAFGRSVLTSILSEGLVATAMKMKGIFTPVVAQVVDGAIDDMKEFADKYTHDSVVEDARDDMQPERADPPDHVPDENTDDMDGDVRGEPPEGTQDEGIVDHQDGKPEGVDGVATEDNSDRREKREKFNMSDSALDDEIHDHQEKLAKLTRVGAKIAHTTKPELAWTVRLASMAQDGSVEVSVSADGRPPRKIGQKDLLAFWRSLDKPLDMPRKPGQPARRAISVSATAQQLQALRNAGLVADVDQTRNRLITTATDEQLRTAGIQPPKPSAVAARTTVPTAQPPKPQAATPAPPPARTAAPTPAQTPPNARQAIALAEKRMKQAWTAKEAKLKQAHEEELEHAKLATIAAFCRALRIAATRQASNLEASPLRQAAEQLLGTNRVIAQDATGAPIQFPGMDPELVRFLVAEIYQHGHAPHLEHLMNRAADLMSKGDQYLLDAEADAANFQPALPPITAASVQPVDMTALYSQQMRQAAMQGNFAVNPQPSDEPGPGAPGPNGFGNDKRTAIRGAVQGTLVSSTLGRLRALN